MSDVTYSLICDILLYSYYKCADTSDLFLLRVGTIYPDTDDIIIEYEPLLMNLACGLVSISTLLIL